MLTRSGAASRTINNKCTKDIVGQAKNTFHTEKDIFKTDKVHFETDKKHVLNLKRFFLTEQAHFHTDEKTLSTEQKHDRGHFPKNIEHFKQYKGIFGF